MRLGRFIRRGWPVLEPGPDSTARAEPLWGWALDAVCDHLQAVTDGQVNRLLITVPPGMMKSLATAVFWPAWEWGPRGLAHLRYLGFSYADRLSNRDNRRCRMLIESEWYQDLWPLPLEKDQNQKTLFENDERGWRMASSVGGVGTGARADRIIVDDPHHVSDGESPAKLAKALLWFSEVLPTRLNSPKHSAIVVIMQRIHESDVAGKILKDELGYEHLMLPMRFEPERRCATARGFVDPRENDGELLFPERFPAEVVGRDESLLGSYASAAQFQQRPAPRGGGLFKVDRIEVVDDWPRSAASIRYWDFASTEEAKAARGTDPDYTAGARASFHEGRFYLIDMQHGRFSPADKELRVKSTALRDGPAVHQWIEQEGGSAGKDTIDHYQRVVLAGLACSADRPNGSKVERAVAFAAAVEAGNVLMVRGPWNEAFLAEARTFPFGAHDDQIDAVVGAWRRLAQAPLFFVG